MFKQKSSESSRGQVGIGTLIVFIAMVLVAAIAAGVLINTAGSLQSQASNTGTETQQAVANQIEVVHAYGDTESPGGNIDQLNLVVKKSAGSDVIDISSMTVQFSSDDTSETLEYYDGGEFGEDLSGIDNGQFATAALTESTEPDAEALVDTSDRIEIQLNTALIANQGALEPGDSATVELVDQSGAQFSYGVTVPATYSDSTEVVEV